MTTTTAPAPATTVITGPVTTLPPTTGPDGKYIDVDAQRLCDLKGASFESQEAISDTLTKRLQEAGISQSDWDAFLKRTQSDESLRGKIADRYAKQCP